MPHQVITAIHTLELTMRQIKAERNSATPAIASRHGQYHAGRSPLCPHVHFSSHVLFSISLPFLQ